MVGCEQGYLCDVCGQDVEQITDSDLYLHYVMGEVLPLALPTMRERHIRCNPATAQYIVDAAFESVGFDLGFGSTPLAVGAFVGLELLSDPYVLLVPEYSPLAELRSA